VARRSTGLAYSSSNTGTDARYLERAVLEAEAVQGTVLRYGGFCGPGTSLGEGGIYLEGVRRRQFPIVAAGTGVWSFIHIDDAATATLAAVANAL
jgi:2-alkyl-3-oxoalkanoate reductase